MPVYLFTFHAYRSWRPDHPKGFVKRGKGILPPDPEMARHYDDAATQPPVNFSDKHQHILIEGALDIASRREWRVHAVASEPTHVHFLISWHDENASHTTWMHVRDKLKSLLGMMLTQHFHPGERGHKWFVRKGSRKRVRDREHFEYLMKTYLPRHDGRCWSERDDMSK